MYIRNDRRLIKEYLKRPYNFEAIEDLKRHVLGNRIVQFENLDVQNTNLYIDSNTIEEEKYFDSYR